MRASLGYWGARLGSSPYRVVAATYWFAAQALAGALGFQALIEGLAGTHLRLVPIALVFAVVQASLAVLGTDCEFDAALRVGHAGRVPRTWTTPVLLLLANGVLAAVAVRQGEAGHALRAVTIGLLIGQQEPATSV